MTANVIRLGRDVKQLEMLSRDLSHGSYFVLIMHLNIMKYILPTWDAVLNLESCQG